MKKSRWDILGIGVAAVDELIYLDRFPQPDQKTPVQEVQRQGGGLTATALVAAARQGAKAAYCAHIGYDELSLYTLAELEREKVDCSLCVRSPEGTPYHSWILVDGQKKTRTILYQRGSIEPPPEAIDEALIGQCNVLLIDNFTPRASLQAAQIARRLGIPVVADLESVQTPNLDSLLANIDHLIIGQELARRLTRGSDIADMVKQLSGDKRACCAITAGERGCWYARPCSEVNHFPAFRVQVADTTGCGDVFHGAYAAALSRGESVSKAIEAAAATAAIKAGRPGGRAGIPDLLTVQRFLTEQYENGFVGNAPA
jgi:sulfofructose kinase